MLLFDATGYLVFADSTTIVPRVTRNRIQAIRTTTSPLSQTGYQELLWILENKYRIYRWKLSEDKKEDDMKVGLHTPWRIEHTCGCGIFEQVRLQQHDTHHWDCANKSFCRIEDCFSTPTDLIIPSVSIFSLRGNCGKLPDAYGQISSLKPARECQQK